jgi:BirA family biotin operon repressor/biotin-[acetyl-CoA-carboxylase] ligase
MNHQEVSAGLEDLPLGEVRWLDSLGSTNDVAREWALNGAPHFSVLGAEEQTAGRGRRGRSWYTPPGSGLAFSLILQGGILLNDHPRESLPRLAGLGVLAGCCALEQDINLRAGIKWPNDILLDRQKVGGVLVELHWLGNQLAAAVVGIGVNVRAESLPANTRLDYPATWLEAHTSQPVARLNLLRGILSQAVSWYFRLSSPEYIEAWNERLAFRKESVLVQDPANPGSVPVEGSLLGIDAQGRLELRTAQGQLFSLDAGELRLRPKEALS